MILRLPRSSFIPYSTLFLFFFNDTATTEIYTLSLHDALPICRGWPDPEGLAAHGAVRRPQDRARHRGFPLAAFHPSERSRRAEIHDVELRSEEHTSGIPSLTQLLFPLFLLKKKKNILISIT